MWNFQARGIKMILQNTNAKLMKGCSGKLTYLTDEIVTMSEDGKISYVISDVSENPTSPILKEIVSQTEEDNSVLDKYNGILSINDDTNANDIIAYSNNGGIRTSFNYSDIKNENLVNSGMTKELVDCVFSPTDERMYGLDESNRLCYYVKSGEMEYWQLLNAIPYSGDSIPKTIGNAKLLSNENYLYIVSYTAGYYTIYPIDVATIDTDNKHYDISKTFTLEIDSSKIEKTDTIVDIKSIKSFSMNINNSEKKYLLFTFKKVVYVVPANLDNSVDYKESVKTIYPRINKANEEEPTSYVYYNVTDSAFSNNNILLNNTKRTINFSDGISPDEKAIIDPIISEEDGKITYSSLNSFGAEFEVIENDGITETTKTISLDYDINYNIPADGINIETSSIAESTLPRNQFDKFIVLRNNDTRNISNILSSRNWTVYQYNINEASDEEGYNEIAHYPIQNNEENTIYINRKLNDVSINVYKPIKYNANEIYKVIDTSGTSAYKQWRLDNVTEISNPVESNYNYDYIIKCPVNGFIIIENPASAGDGKYIVDIDSNTGQDIVINSNALESHYYSECYIGVIDEFHNLKIQVKENTTQPIEPIEPIDIFTKIVENENIVTKHFKLFPNNYFGISLVNNVVNNEVSNEPSIISDSEETTYTKLGIASALSNENETNWHCPIIKIWLSGIYNIKEKNQYGDFPASFTYKELLGLFNIEYSVKFTNANEHTIIYNVNNSDCTIDDKSVTVENNTFIKDGYTYFLDIQKCEVSYGILYTGYPIIVNLAEYKVYRYSNAITINDYAIDNDMLLKILTISTDDNGNSSFVLGNSTYYIDNSNTILSSTKFISIDNNNQFSIGTTTYGIESDRNILVNGSGLTGLTANITKENSKYVFSINDNHYTIELEENIIQNLIKNVEDNIPLTELPDSNHSRVGVLKAYSVRINGIDYQLEFTGGSDDDSEIIPYFARLVPEIGQETDTWSYIGPETDSNDDMIGRIEPSVKYRFNLNGTFYYTIYDKDSNTGICTSPDTKEITVTDNNVFYDENIKGIIRLDDSIVNYYNTLPINQNKFTIDETTYEIVVTNNIIGTNIIKKIDNYWTIDNIQYFDTEISNTRYIATVIDNITGDSFTIGDITYYLYNNVIYTSKVDYDINKNNNTVTINNIEYKIINNNLYRSYGINSIHNKKFTITYINDNSSLKYNNNSVIVFDKQYNTTFEAELNKINIPVYVAHTTEQNYIFYEGFVPYENIVDTSTVITSISSRYAENILPYNEEKPTYLFIQTGNTYVDENSCTLARCNTYVLNSDLSWKLLTNETSENKCANNIIFTPNFTLPIAQFKKGDCYYIYSNHTQTSNKLKYYSGYYMCVNPEANSLTGKFVRLWTIDDENIYNYKKFYKIDTHNYIIVGIENENYIFAYDFDGENLSEAQLYLPNIQIIETKPDTTSYRMVSCGGSALDVLSYNNTKTVKSNIYLTVKFNNSTYYITDTVGTIPIVLTSLYNMDLSRTDIFVTKPISMLYDKPENRETINALPLSNELESTDNGFGGLSVLQNNDEVFDYSIFDYDVITTQENDEISYSIYPGIETKGLLKNSLKVDALCYNFTLSNIFDNNNNNFFSFNKNQILYRQCDKNGPDITDIYHDPYYNITAYEHVKENNTTEIRVALFDETGHFNMPEFFTNLENAVPSIGTYTNVTNETYSIVDMIAFKAYNKPIIIGLFNSSKILLFYGANVFNNKTKFYQGIMPKDAEGNENRDADFNIPYSASEYIQENYKYVSYTSKNSKWLDIDINAYNYNSDEPLDEGDYTGFNNIFVHAKHNQLYLYITTKAGYVLYRELNPLHSIDYLSMIPKGYGTMGVDFNSSENPNQFICNNATENNKPKAYEFKTIVKNIDNTGFSNINAEKYEPLISLLCDTYRQKENSQPPITQEENSQPPIECTSLIKPFMNDDNKKWRVLLPSELFILENDLENINISTIKSNIWDVYEETNSEEYGNIIHRNIILLTGYTTNSESSKKSRVSIINCDNGSMYNPSANINITNVNFEKTYASNNLNKNVIKFSFRDAQSKFKDIITHSELVINEVGTVTNIILLCKSGRIIASKNIVYTDDTNEWIYNVTWKEDIENIVVDLLKDEDLINSFEWLATKSTTDGRFYATGKYGIIIESDDCLNFTGRIGETDITHIQYNEDTDSLDEYSLDYTNPDAEDESDTITPDEEIADYYNGEFENINVSPEYDENENENRNDMLIQPDALYVDDISVYPLYPKNLANNSYVRMIPTIYELCGLIDGINQYYDSNKKYFSTLQLYEANKKSYLVDANGKLINGNNYNIVKYENVANSIVKYWKYNTVTNRFDDVTENVTLGYIIPEDYVNIALKKDVVYKFKKQYTSGKKKKTKTYKFKYNHENDYFLEAKHKGTKTAENKKALKKMFKDFKVEHKNMAQGTSVTSGDTTTHYLGYKDIKKIETAFTIIEGKKYIKIYPTYQYYLNELDNGLIGIKKFNPATSEYDNIVTYDNYQNNSYDDKTSNLKATTVPVITIDMDENGNTVRTETSVAIVKTPSTSTNVTTYTITIKKSSISGNNSNTSITKTVITKTENLLTGNIIIETTKNGSTNTATKNYNLYDKYVLQTPKTIVVRVLDVLGKSSLEFKNKLLTYDFENITITSDVLQYFTYTENVKILNNNYSYLVSYYINEFLQADRKNSGSNISALFKILPEQIVENNYIINFNTIYKALEDIIEFRSFDLNTSTSTYGQETASSETEEAQEQQPKKLTLITYSKSKADVPYGFLDLIRFVRTYKAIYSEASQYLGLIGTIISAKKETATSNGNSLIESYQALDIDGLALYSKKTSLAYKIYKKALEIRDNSKYAGKNDCDDIYLNKIAQSLALQYGNYFNRIRWTLWTIQTFRNHYQKLSRGY